MRRIIFGFFVLVGIVLAGCGGGQATAPADVSDVVITLERTVCFGACPAYKVTIRGDGTVTYEGYSFVELEGEKSYSIPVKDVHTLVEIFYELDFFGLEDKYVANVTDLPSTTTTITINGQTKSVYRYGNGPENLLTVELSVDEIARTAPLVGRSVGD